MNFNSTHTHTHTHTHSWLVILSRALRCGILTLWLSQWSFYLFPVEQTEVFRLENIRPRPDVTAGTQTLAHHTHSRRSWSSSPRLWSLSLRQDGSLNHTLDQFSKSKITLQQDKRYDPYNLGLRQKSWTFRLNMCGLITTYFAVLFNVLLMMFHHAVCPQNQHLSDSLFLFLFFHVVG